MWSPTELLVQCIPGDHLPCCKRPEREANCRLVFVSKLKMRESILTENSSLLGCDVVSAVGRVLPCVVLGCDVVSAVGRVLPCVAKCRSASSCPGILRPLSELPISQLYVTSWAPELIVVTWRRERCLLFPGIEPPSCRP